MTAEQFNFNSSLKKKIAILGISGIVVLALGIIFLIFGGSGHEAADAAHGAAAGHGGGHAEFHWYDRLFTNLWINNVYFTGLGVIGLFFVALQYAAQAGWSAGIKRIPEAFGAWLPYAAVLMLLVFFIGGHTIFHWTHEYLYDEADPRYDSIIAGKRGYLNTPFFVIRMVVYFAVWYLMYRLIRKESLAEDINGGTAHHFKLVKLSTIFIVFFAVTSSTSAWDWTLSIDTHWFSTMYGWYNFASWFVSGLAAITLIVVMLRENGYIKLVSSEHLHDLGKFVFAFSIFWAYIWFGQFLLIYYANIPEETIYFLERLESDFYSPFFFGTLILNFFFPFLVLMTRDSKRHTVFLKLVCTVVLIGQWLNFYLMITPGILKENGGLGFMELGTTMIYLAAFLYVVLNNLSKASLVAKNHPMLQESIHHHT
ncbi:quinol:cytochrome C oxidoreductase [Porifericola rhodea]|uniref:quinol:cytochrome C oxidoreductase n=1 Tax=Porifericola rhodea TaxID=930972 RepID=UPI00266679EF|nr:quinol:cytochrome C oxidoreductase [Porifericola rhodea]WKN30621.1 quinol:cytochrome C oxidoreductase [Porifericola rhodea]